MREDIPVAIFRKSVLAVTLIGAGLASTSGAAFAHESDGDEQNGVANVDGIQTIVPTNVCNNNVPVNVGGVQVPIQDVAGNIPVLSPSDDGGNSAGIAKDCTNGVAADND